MNPNHDIGYFGDDRLRRAGASLFAQMLKEKSVSLRGLGKNRAGQVKYGNFLANERVTVNEIIQSAVEKTNRISAGAHVLAIQDSSEINHQKHAARVEGLGVVGNGKDAGFFIHPLLIVDAQSGACFGLGAAHHWIRTGPKEERSKLLIEKKESYRWLEVAEAGKNNLSEAAMITVVADRESDIYEEWCRIPDERTHLLTRSARDRRISGGKLFSYASGLPLATTYEVELSERAGKRTKHVAKLDVRYGEVELIKPTKKCVDPKAPPKIKLRVIDVLELDPQVFQLD